MLKSSFPSFLLLLYKNNLNYFLQFCCINFLSVSDHYFQKAENYDRLVYLFDLKKIMRQENAVLADRACAIKVKN